MDRDSLMQTEVCTNIASRVQTFLTRVFGCTPTLRDAEHAHEDLPQLYGPEFAASSGEEIEDLSIEFYETVSSVLLAMNIPVVVFPITFENVSHICLAWAPEVRKSLKDGRVVGSSTTSTMLELTTDEWLSSLETRSRHIGEHNVGSSST